MENIIKKIYASGAIPVLKNYDEKAMEFMVKAGVSCVLIKPSEEFLSIKSHFPNLLIGAVNLNIEDKNYLSNIELDFILSESKNNNFEIKNCENYGSLKMCDLDCDCLYEHLENDDVLACFGDSLSLDEAILHKDYEKVMEISKSFLKNSLGLYVAHVGIKSKDKDESDKNTSILAQMMVSTIDTRPTSYFVDAIEILNYNGKGTHGHIAIGVTNYNRAKAYFLNQGFLFDEDTVKIRDGKPFFIYFSDEIGGFKYHLVQNPKKTHSIRHHIK